MYLTSTSLRELAAWATPPKGSCSFNVDAYRDSDAVSIEHGNLLSDETLRLMKEMGACLSIQPMTTSSPQCNASLIPVMTDVIARHHV